VGEGDSDSELDELFFSSGVGEAEASALVVDDFFFAVVDDEDEEAEVSPAVELFFLAVSVVDALVVPDFFVAVVVVVDFLPVDAVVLVADSFLCAQETKKTPATRSAIKVNADFFIGFCKGSQTVQPCPKPQAFSADSYRISQGSDAIPRFLRKCCRPTFQVSRVLVQFPNSRLFA